MPDFDTLLTHLRAAYNRGRSGEALPQPDDQPPTVYTKRHRASWYMGFRDFQRFGAIE